MEHVEFNETDIPTQQTPPQKNDRLPRPHENPRRSKSHQSPPPPRPQETCRLTFSQAKTSRLIFPKAVRLRSRGEFQRVVREGKRLVGKFLCIDCRCAPQSKLGISASGKYGSSPERNRFKRLVREAFRKSYASLPPLELNVIPRAKAKQANCAEITDELVRLLK